MKTCTSCNTEQPLESYSKASNTKDKLSYWCKSCCAEKQRVDRSSRVAFYREMEYKRRYGITIDDYNRMYDQQSSCCKICGQHFDRLCVDHCHNTGDVRGLLCRKCNVALGQFDDDIKLVSKALEYLTDKRIPEEWLDE